MSAYCPLGISFRQLVILVDHSDVNFLPLPTKDPYQFKSAWSLVERRLLRFHHRGHTCLTDKGRKTLWAAMDIYIRVFQRAQFGEDFIKRVQASDKPLVWFRDSSYVPAHAETTETAETETATAELEAVACGLGGEMAHREDQALPEQCTHP